MSRTINGVEFPTPEPALLQTTLSLAEAAKECGDGYCIANELGLGPDDQANLLDVLRVGGVDNALWCLRCVLPGQEEARDRVARLIAAECAARVLHLYEAKHPGDDRPRRAIEVARDFAFGLIAAPALYSAWVAVMDAASGATKDANWAALEASRAIAGAAATEVWDANWNVAGHARAAAWWVEMDKSVVDAAERKAQAEILRAYLKGGEA